MKNINCIVLIGCFGLSISCTSKPKTTDVTDIKPLQPPIVNEPIPQQPITKILKKDPTTPAISNSYTCNVEGTPRTIKVNKIKDKCTVEYTKFGSTTQVAWGQTNPKICTNVLNKIKTNIEFAGFKCTSKTN